jgi:hypothetical protein
MAVRLSVERIPAAGVAVGGISIGDGVNFALDIPVACVAMTIGGKELLLTRDEATYVAHMLRCALLDA